MARILVIDDEPDIGHIMRTALESRGHNVILADDGSRGLATVRRQRPDIIVLDLIMPVMDGFQVLDLLGADEKTRGVPVVVLTAVTTAATRERCEAKGVVRFITKPFDPYRVADAVEAVLLRRVTTRALNGS